MARRADHTREELMDLAISAGLELINKEGFSNFSARKVAAGIGYTVGTLYNVFGSYDGLILHINARTLDEWYGAMQAAVEKDKGKNPVRAMAHAYIDYSITHRQQWLALFEYHTDSPIPEWYLPKMARFFTLVENLLLPVLHHNRRKTKRAARVLWAGIHGICVLSSSGKLDMVESDSAEVLAMSFIEHYLAGLSKEGR